MPADRPLVACPHEEVPAPPREVRAFYVDLDNIRAVHPLVLSVRSLSRTETPGGYRQTYRVTDRIPLGPLTIRTRYVARMTVPWEGDVEAEARQFPRVRLSATVTFAPAGTGTQTTERLTIDAPGPLPALTRREAVEAHKTMLAGIRRRFS
ncbi:SRPBCC family protein [Mycobacterium sp. CPCC 205710]|uniref:SRPBCC family protein n=1 Tax=Mycobacterium deserti TaxID=2978347 RepID=A0ABT2MIB5_9MYCO|nr:SRPBCC family protein [Mycobacterium deserti]MCT7662028.1 SRPBCC family protein [Mycobacterium deserti]